MAADMRISGALAIVNCDSLVDAVDTGTSSFGNVNIRSGAPPATVETVMSGTLLALILFQNPAFGAAADQAPNARAAMAGSPSQTSATGAGTAGYYRTHARPPSTTALWQNTAGAAASGEGMELSNAVIAVGQTVTLTSWDVDVLET